MSEILAFFETPDWQRQQRRAAGRTKSSVIYGYIGFGIFLMGVGLVFSLDPRPPGYRSRLLIALLSGVGGLGLACAGIKARFAKAKPPGCRGLEAACSVFYSEAFIRPERFLGRRDNLMVACRVFPRPVIDRYNRNPWTGQGPIVGWHPVRCANCGATWPTPKKEGTLFLCAHCGATVCDRCAPGTQAVCPTCGGPLGGWMGAGWRWEALRERILRNDKHPLLTVAVREVPREDPRVVDVVVEIKKHWGYLRSFRNIAFHAGDEWFLGTPEPVQAKMKDDAAS